MVTMYNSKFFLFLLLSCIIVSNLFSQDKNFVQQPSLSIGYGLYDFKTVQNLKTASFFTAIKDGKVAKLKSMNSALVIDYTEGITKNLDFAVETLGSFLSYPIKNKPSFTKNSLLLELDVLVKAKPWTNKRTVVPYFLSGLGTTKYLQYYAVQIPTGIGAQFNLSNEMFINLASQYRFAITKTATNHFFASIAIGGVIGQRKNKKIVKNISVLNEYKTPVDSDADGILDSADKCPLVKGLIRFQGCPDSDNDGIEDAFDKCAQVQGTIKYEGCPIPDTDSDGINDEEDSCVTIPGLVQYFGCPLPDKDQDGIADEADKCPEISGTASNQGCPKISDSLLKSIDRLAEDILFTTGSAVLTKDSEKNIKKIMALIKNDSLVRINISAHTDSDGDSLSNQLLSEKRLHSVLIAFKNAGFPVEKINGTAYGESRPKINNSTHDGKQKNRRVEVSLYY